MIVKMISIIVIAMYLILFSYSVFAEPQGAGQIEKGIPDRRTTGLDTISGTAVQAQAGNVTALNINSTRLTSRWQGYYGNVTGAITLDDASNNTLYNWQLASPQGEVYASNGSESGAVTWTNVFCFNYSNNLSDGQPVVQRFNGTDLERAIGASTTDKDSVNSTFNSTFTGTFQVGGITISSSSGCRQTTLFVNDQYQQTDFIEVLLTDNNSIVYTALLEQDATGFSGSTLDFEMIVGENGDIASATTYYFFVELA